MAMTTRLILILSLLIQSVPGLTAMSCALMGPRSPESLVAASVDGSACPCCRGGDGAMKAACPNGDKVTACGCGMAQPEEPRTPPTNSRTEQTHQFVALLPILLAVLPPAPAVLALRWTSPAGPPKRS
ncbi:MAG: hypothetical protein WC718_02770, partial [Phycisphaerales bacterium]